ncbi:MAG: MFS transporter [Rhodospirillales bacterium]|nr:MFS transporter [Rhodospirillales bacterium]
MHKLRDFAAAYGDRKVLAVLLLGFSSGLPLLLTFSTLSAWLAQKGVDRAAIGYFALVATPYAFKFLWSPLIDRLPPPIPGLGRRRGWGLFIQILLIGAILALGTTDPTRNLFTMAVLAVIVSFLSASQDIVIDAYRVEILDEAQQGPGAGAVQAGYRIAMLAAGAGALFLADTAGWFTAYATMAALLAVGMLVFLFGPEPAPHISAATIERERRAAAFIATRPHLRGMSGKVLAWLYGAVVCPFADFMTRPAWLAVLIFIMTYKLGEAMAGSMANTLYISLGFSLTEMAWVSKIFGFAATVIGSILGGALVVRMGALRALLIFGVLQSLGNLFYVVQAQAGHDVMWLAVCVAAENLTAGMAGSALVAYISRLCNVAYTATQYALLSSLTAVGRTTLASFSGKLSQDMGWTNFFLFTTVVTLPALLLLLWMMRRIPVAEGRAEAKAV